MVYKTYMRCIGGPSSGCRVEINEGQKDISVIDPMKTPKAPLRMEQVPETVSYKHTIYTRRQVNTQGGKIYFLAPANLSDYVVLRKILE